MDNKLVNTDLNLRRIFNVVEFVSNIDIGEKTRKRVTVYNKWIFYKLAKKYTDFSLVTIGGFCQVDHVSVLHGLKEFENEHIYKHLKDNYLKCVTIIEMISDRNFVYPAEAIVFNRRRPTIAKIITDVETVLNEYEAEMAFYKHNFYEDYPNLYRLMTEAKPEKLKEFDNFNARHFLKTIITPNKE